MPVMLDHSFAIDLGDRHGSLLGIAELSTGFCALPDKCVISLIHIGIDCE